ncbi:hypothetical protein BZA70DRAFT_284252 [Myxozyma melibiosi]|uniref:VanZ-like domain-containing protein n=1 Tax=Myxozyma melibiosi TaxID=54550 RepID=A0ABR1EZA4_9ASCO
MRIRKSFLAVFIVLALITLYLGFAPIQFEHDKVLHFTFFFLLTTSFYWVVDTTRRRLVNATFLVCVVLGGVGSELVQAAIVKYRVFDWYDILANVLGSSLALLISTFYHKRLLERKRAQKYAQLHSTDPADLEAGVTDSIAMENLMPEMPAEGAVDAEVEGHTAAGGKP